MLWHTHPDDIIAPARSTSRPSRKIGLESRLWSAGGCYEGRIGVAMLCDVGWAGKDGYQVQVHAHALRCPLHGCVCGLMKGRAFQA